MSREIVNTADGHQWHITESEAADAGLTLRMDDGTAGTWGHMWNTGIYHFDETPVTLAQVRALLKFSVKNKRPARSLYEATETN